MAISWQFLGNFMAMICILLTFCWFLDCFLPVFVHFLDSFSAFLDMCNWTLGISLAISWQFLGNFSPCYRHAVFKKITKPWQFQSFLSNSCQILDRFLVSFRQFLRNLLHQFYQILPITAWKVNNSSAAIFKEQTFSYFYVERICIFMIFFKIFLQIIAETIWRYNTFPKVRSNAWNWIKTSYMVQGLRINKSLNETTEQKLYFSYQENSFKSRPQFSVLKVHSLKAHAWIH